MYGFAGEEKKIQPPGPLCQGGRGSAAAIHFIALQRERRPIYLKGVIRLGPLTRWF